MISLCNIFIHKTFIFNYTHTLIYKNENKIYVCMYVSMNVCMIKYIFS